MQNGTTRQKKKQIFSTKLVSVNTILFLAGKIRLQDERKLQGEIICSEKLSSAHAAVTGVHSLSRASLETE